jgi:hypothetical protein
MYTAVDGTYLGMIDPGELVGWMDKTQKNEKGWDYSQIKRPNGKEVWALSSYLIRGTRPGIIIKEGFIYSEPALSKLTSEKVGTFTIVAGLKDPKTPDFVQVSYMYYNKEKVLSQKMKVYVKSDMVSFFDADIQATLLYKKSQDDKIEPAVKLEFLKSAVQLESPSFKQIFATELASLESIESETKGGDSSGSGDIMDFQATFITTGENVALYEEPSIDSTKLGAFGENVKLTFDRRTVERKDVGGTKDFWYHIPNKGWVFGDLVIGSGD